MDLEIRHPDPAELGAVFDVWAQAFAMPESDRERWTGMVDPAGMLTAFLGGRVVGSLTALEAGQWLGGRSVPLGALATVVVRPELRGRGVRARLLAASLEHMRERGLVVSTLHPATTRAYRAAGWEIGGDYPIVTVPTRSLERLHPGEPERLVRLDRDDWPLVQSCYDTAAPSGHGRVDRSAPWWDRLATERFELQVEDGRGELVTGGTGEVQLTVNALGALSTGWAAAAALAAAGTLHHATDADRRALDAIFAGPRASLLDDF